MKCKHKQKVMGPGSGPHAARLMCARCGLWIKWLSKK